MQYKLLLASTVAFFALVNPIQKIMVITTLSEQFGSDDLRRIAYRSTFTALGTLILFLFVGEALLGYVFHVELYAFRLTSGFVLLTTGLTALQKGVFIKIDGTADAKQIITVPVAIPMIAGPGTITAAATFPSQYGRWNTLIAMIIALGLNLALMLAGKKIGEFLIRINVMNSLVRIFGLLVATIGFQMGFDGIAQFIESIK